MLNQLSEDGLLLVQLHWALTADMKDLEDWLHDMKYLTSWLGQLKDLESHMNLSTGC